MGNEAKIAELKNEHKREAWREREGAGKSDR